VPTPGEAVATGSEVTGIKGKERTMGTKIFTRTMWTLFAAAVMTGYATSLARLVGIEV